MMSGQTGTGKRAYGQSDVQTHGQISAQVESSASMSDMRDTAARTRRPRPSKWEDDLPENMTFRDDGCDIHPHCLTCPLPRCKYDDPQGVRRLLQIGRDAEIVRLRREEGVPVNLLAQLYGLSRRSVFRILRRWDEDGAAEVITLYQEWTQPAPRLGAP